MDIRPTPGECGFLYYIARTRPKNRQRAHHGVSTMYRSSTFSHQGNCHGFRYGSDMLARLAGRGGQLDVLQIIQLLRIPRKQDATNARYNFKRSSGCAVCIQQCTATCLHVDTSMRQPPVRRLNDIVSMSLRTVQI